MANLTESAAWAAGIYRLEVTDPVEGGVDGVSNLQAKQLADRTLFLKGAVEAAQADADAAHAAAVAAQADVDTLVDVLPLKAPVESPSFTGTVSGVTKAMVGLGNVDNTADMDKPVSTAQQAVLDTKAPLASPSFTGTVSGVTKAMVGLGSVDNTADADKPVSTAQQAALDAKADEVTSQVLSVASATVAAVVGVRYVLDANNITLTAPTGAAKGDFFGFRLMDGRTGCAVDFGAQKLRGVLPGVMALDIPRLALDLVFEDVTRGYI